MAIIPQRWQTVNHPIKRKQVLEGVLTGGEQALSRSNPGEQLQAYHYPIIFIIIVEILAQSNALAMHPTGLNWMGDLLSRKGGDFYV